MASYNIFKRKIQRAEGGYQNLVNDSGNYNSLKQRVGTNFGVSAKVYERVIGRPPTITDMKSITQAEAHQIFKRQFWDAIKADSINSQALAETFADHAINASPKASTKIMQKVLNTVFGKWLVIDGVVGSKTLSAINSVDSIALFNAFSNSRIEYYNRLRDCVHFCKVWHNRVHELAKDHNVDISKPVTKVSKKKTLLLTATAVTLVAVIAIVKIKSKK